MAAWFINNTLCLWAARLIALLSALLAVVFAAASYSTQCYRSNQKNLFHNA
jgi:hypothetical protein